MFKKLFAILLACLMLLPGGIAMAEEAEALTSGDYEYTLNDDGSASITDYSGNAKALTVPAELDGHSVTSIGDKAFYDCESLTTITLPDSVTSIGNYAFFWCTSLTAITLPDSVTSIGDYAFNCCSSLTTITLPDSVTSIGANAFAECPKLTLTVPRDSYALAYTKENGIPYTHPDSMDWLNG